MVAGENAAKLEFLRIRLRVRFRLPSASSEESRICPAGADRERDSLRATGTMADVGGRPAIAEDACVDVATREVDAQKRPRAIFRRHRRAAGGHPTGQIKLNACHVCPIRGQVRYTHRARRPRRSGCCANSVPPSLYLDNAARGIAVHPRLFLLARRSIAEVGRPSRKTGTDSPFSGRPA